MADTDPFTMTAQGESSYRPATKRIEQGSLQQELFWSVLLSGEKHVLLEARAGTGKSSSCREGMHRLNDEFGSVRSSYVAFNKSIADEFGQNLPSGAKATTMHAAGCSAVRNEVCRTGKLENFKQHRIADSFIKEKKVKSPKLLRQAAVKLANLCKSHLIGHDDNSFKVGLIPAVLDRLAAAYGVDIRGMRTELLDLIPHMLRAAMEQVATIDFNDMVWLPVVLNLDFPPVDFLFVDEAQDLDPCQHALVRRMAGDGRMVVVGDRYQAIYAFRGADSASMGTLSDQLWKTRRGLTRLPLTRTRRCPSSHVALAKRIVTDFEAMPSAPEGEWTENASEDQVLTPGVLALSRSNAPLLSTALQLAAANVPVGIQGRDIGDGLVKFVEQFGAATIAELTESVCRYHWSEMDRLSALEDTETEAAALNDRVACVHALASRSDSPGQVAGKIKRLFLDVTPENQSKLVLLSSIHRAKGRESDRVAILQPESMPHKSAATDEARQQEMNLIYVATTRSKRDLAFCGPLPWPIAEGGGS